MDKIAEANFNLGEAGVYASLGLGAVGIGVGTVVYYSSNISSDPTMKTIGSVTGIIAALIGLGVYYVAYGKWKAYKKIRKEIK